MGWVSKKWKQTKKAVKKHGKEALSMGTIGLYDAYESQKQPKDNSADEARRMEEERQERIREGTAKVDDLFSQFNDGFYDNIRKSALDYYNPIVDEQYGRANASQTFQLANQGNLQSSAAAQRMADLFKDYGTTRQQVVDRAFDIAQNHRAGVEDNRSALYGQLHGGASLDTVANLASTRAAMMNQVPTFSPLGDLFSQYTNAAAQSVNAERMGYPGMGLTSGYQTTPSYGSVRTVR